jgi:uncharacterized damage-inducible protein DinB
VSHSGISQALTRVAMLALATAAIATPLTVRAQAQQGKADPPVFDAKAVAQIKKSYLTDLDTLRSKFLQLANAIPADKYSWRPAAGVRSISEVFMHVAGEWYHWAPSSIGGKPPADYPATGKDIMAKLETLEKITAKAEVIDQLNKSWAHCKAQINAADPAKLTGKYDPWKTTIDAAALGMAGDLHEHLGQLVAYARSVGVKPPWSK